MARKRVVLQGFGTYGGHSLNPSEMLVRDLAGAPLEGLEVVPYILRTAVSDVRNIPGQLAAIQPDFWIGIGLADGRVSLAVERVALNLCEFPQPDVDGATLVGVPCVEGGPPAYFSTIPVKAIVQAWRNSGMAGYVSYSAGTYLCNQAFYLASHAAQGTRTRVGFVHVPFLPQQVSDPRSVASVPYETQRSALLTLLATILAEVPEPPEPMGFLA